MTSRGNTRAVVLGGGGTVGVAWQTGLLTGLRDAGVDLAEAPAVVGTSAGSLVGALLAGGRDVTDAVGVLAEVGRKLDFDSLGAGSQNFLDASRRAVFATDQRQALRALGSAAQEAPTTLTEDEYLGLLGMLDGVAWPAGFRCTAIDTGTGELVVWGEESGVPLLHAVAASCVIPMLFPTVTINGNRYMDGGIVNHLNAAAAPPSDVLVVVSCLPLGAPDDGTRSASTIEADAEVAQLRGKTRLVAVDPDFGDLEAPVKMMDPETAGRALHIGRRQAEREAVAIRAAWDL
ncbi:patatin-like phospholipase family protein [Amycolatopsis sp. WQ 127309]|uniref:patatin-like phospholipase family protein n=1 Tax=Amycolatopsis sp. WQ 127309 TaxID=2932773 RepID=UPI001FF21CAE|nr:patatin-like phospholipase family protein [Amycolatopsis sp. WQ 127309]UOZ05604.1 patatin-like phospholipase family protein [Amycolatopsis sp. WQ 127309]